MGHVDNVCVRANRYTIITLLVGNPSLTQAAALRLSIRALIAKIQPDKFVRWCSDGDFLRPVFAASRVQHISDLHSKFALEPLHV